MWVASLLFVVLVLFGGERTVLKAGARNVPPAQCANTASGRHFLTDSHGYVCTRRELDYTSGCCYSGAMNSCETCHEDDQCCSSYEHCVSCCLKPEYNAQTLVKTQFRIHDHPSTGKWDDAFQYCMGKCRTHKRSTVHENAFIDDRHFCFSDSSRPKDTKAITVIDPESLIAEGCPSPGFLGTADRTPKAVSESQTDKEPVSIPDGISVHAGAKGADCDTTCTEAGLHCAPEAVQAISSCDLLREHFECEAGCTVGENSNEVPAYIVYGTPKPLYPTMCFTASPDVVAGSCGASQAHLQRLCACAPWKPSETLVSMEAGTEDAEKQDLPAGDDQGNSTKSEAAEDSKQASPVTKSDKTPDS